MKRLKFFRFEHRTHPAGPKLLTGGRHVVVRSRPRPVVIRLGEGIFTGSSDSPGAVVLQLGQGLWSSSLPPRARGSYRLHPGIESCIRVRNDSSRSTKARQSKRKLPGRKHSSRSGDYPKKPTGRGKSALPKKSNRLLALSTSRKKCAKRNTGVRP